jgi:aryl-phospho-beta-D-glucosidase BglC (GH1 family)
MALHGVNLGNWIVLERWMGGSPLSGANVEDDHAFVLSVPPKERDRRLRSHYDTFVTQSTFAWLARAGVALVRIPVPYHLFGTDHHVACLPWLDKAFDWAERYDLRVLIDLHTVPMSQNGFDNGGYTGLCAWGRDESRVRWTLDLLERIARRYATRQALWGIEPLNEPTSWPVFAAKALGHAKAGHLERVLRSWPLSRRGIERFYQEFYDRVRPIVGPEVKLVFHDRFSLRGWERFDPGHGDNNVWMDTHAYAAFSDARLKRHDLAEYLALVEHMAADIERMAANHPVLVGEWSLANHARDLALLKQQGDTDKVRAWYRTFADAQLAAWDRFGGSCFWSLDVRARGRDDWSFGTCVERGWLSLGQESMSPMPRR